MAQLLLLHLLAAVVAPAFVRLLHRKAFLVLALVPAISFGWLVSVSTQVREGNGPTQQFAWVPGLGLDLDFRVTTLSWVLGLLVTGVGALVLLYCALQLTAAYARTREQFSRPIGSFQAVSQRLADAYIDVQGLRLTTTNAAWRLAEGLPADVEVATAKLWAADTGHKVAHTTVHVHGGVGIDLDGEAHRFFTGAKRNEFVLGGATEQARTIGRLLAAEA